jgi:beta-glucosidase
MSRKISLAFVCARHRGNRRRNSARFARRGMAIAAALALACLQAAAAGPAARPDYLDTRLSFRVRAADLVAQMTLAETVGQMQNAAPAIPRLGVPAYDWWSEGLHGVARAGKATSFPQAIGMAATFDPALVHAEATAISDEARAKYNRFQQRGMHGRYEGLTFWAPVINIDRDPRWGRGQETFGEDPYLTSRMGVAFVEGLQGTDPRYRKVDATAKHFALYSGPESGRHHRNIDVSDEDLYDTYLPAFQALVQTGKVAAVMASYSSVDGTPAVANHRLLQGILRGAWGYQGYVVSDCDAVGDVYQTRKLVPTAAQAAALAANAGTDLDCGDTYAALVKAVHAGKVSERTLDAEVTRLMLARFRLGMFDPPAKVPWSKLPYSVVESPRHVALARRAADESMVLLRNAGVLPLSTAVRRIAVIGPTADSVPALLGDYHGTPAHPVTVLDGIRSAAPGATVTYEKGAELVAGFDGPDVGTVVPAQYLRPAPGSDAHGLRGEYFHGAGFSGTPVLTRVDPEVDFNWVYGVRTVDLVAEGTLSETQAKRLSGGPFAVRWNGLLTPPVTGRYELGAAADSGFKLYLDGRLVLDRMDAASKLAMPGAHVDLVAGRSYRVRLEYVHGENNASVRLAWRLPGAKSPFEAALDAARKADVVIFVGGLTAQIEGEEMPVRYPGFDGGDRTDLRLPATQQKLLEAVQATGKPVVLVLTGGSALALDWAKQHVSAILMAWYPGGQGGNAVADALFGKIDPAGRLPVTFYTGVAQLPPFDDYAMAGRTYRYFTGQPLFPFGYGLSYTTFAYSGLHLSHTALAPNEPLRVSVSVRNTGRVAGDEVVQLYVHADGVPGIRAVKTLAGFQRVALAPGQQREVSFDLTPLAAVRHYDPATHAYVVPAGRYTLQVGGSSADVRLQQAFTVRAPAPRG